MIDLKIEITNFYSIHQASLLLEHAIRINDAIDKEWKPFTPSRFVYSYFAFNSICNINWKDSITKNSATYWEHDGNNKFPDEDDKIKSLLQFCRDQLGDEAHPTFLRILNDQIEKFNIFEPVEDLKQILPSNENKKLEKRRKAIPQNFRAITKKNVSQKNFYDQLCFLVGFIQAVRNNIFHGSKSQIKMHDQAQQTRLLIYTAIINATNGLFFEAILATNINWWKPSVDFDGEF